MKMIPQKEVIMPLRKLSIFWWALRVVWAMHLFYLNGVHSSKGIIQEVFIDSKFDCDASHLLKSKAATEIQCVHRCARNEKCELLNYNHQSNEKEVKENCEIYLLSKSDSSCKRVPNQKGWKAANFQVLALAEKELDCQPERDPQGSTPSPEIVISFSNVSSTTEVAYDIGVDSNGQSTVMLERNATVGTSLDRNGKVLHLNGLRPAALVGNFAGHPLNNPNTCTISLWIKVLSIPKGAQAIFSTGKRRNNSGITMELKDNATTIFAEFIKGNAYRNLSCTVRGSLSQWTHVALVVRKCERLSGQLYVNGTMVAESGTTLREDTTTTKFKAFVFGFDEEQYTSSVEHYNMQIDDFRYWSILLTGAEIQHVMNEDSSGSLVETSGK